jgi:DNA-binding response OmpR family regulator
MHDAGAPEVIAAGDVAVDRERREVRVRGESVAFTTKEFELLEFLVERPNVALNRREILDGVWGYDWLGSTRTVDVHVAQLRKKVDGALTIETVRGVGYRLAAPA